MKKWKGYTDYQFLKDKHKVFYMVDKDIQEMFSDRLDHNQRSLHFSEVNVNIRKKPIMEKLVADLG